MFELREKKEGEASTAATTYPGAGGDGGEAKEDIGKEMKYIKGVFSFFFFSFSRCEMKGFFSSMSKANHHEYLQRYRPQRNKEI